MFMKSLAVATCALLFSAAPAEATMASLVVSDASKIQFEADSNGKIYFRNLSSFNASWPGCCFVIWIDSTTDAGKLQYAAFLGAYYGGRRITIYADTAGGAINQIGDF